VEIDPVLVALANANAARNGMARNLRFIGGDVRARDIGRVAFAHVFFNPPFHPANGQPSPSAARDRATRGGDIAGWVRHARDVIRPSGTITAILRADRLDEVREEAAAILPLAPREGEAPKRVIVQFRKTAARDAAVKPALVLHQADGKPTEEADAVLRRAVALIL
jgi:tRNA1(Val) A37 N6-methylase TrmN6